jgi:hypothetical protein
MSLQEFKDDLAVSIYGITKAEAVARGVCIQCHKPPVFHTPLGHSEYLISGLCEPCWDDMFDQGEDDE